MSAVEQKVSEGLEGLTSSVEIDSPRQSVVHQNEFLYSAFPLCEICGKLFASVTLVNPSSANKSNFLFYGAHAGSLAKEFQIYFDSDSSNMNSLYSIYKECNVIVGTRSELESIFVKVLAEQDTPYMASMNFKTDVRDYKIRIRDDSTLTMRNGVPEEEITVEFLDSDHNLYKNPTNHMFTFLENFEQDADFFYEKFKGQKVEIHPYEGIVKPFNELEKTL